MEIRKHISQELPLGLTRDTVVYVMCQPLMKTGGTELLHQLVYEMRKMGITATIAYRGAKRAGMMNPIHVEFKKYVTNYTYLEDIQDIAGNCLIIPEVDIRRGMRFKNIYKIIWWLSVDNYFSYFGVRVPVKRFGIRNFLLMLVSNNKINFSNRLLKKADWHLCQSGYALRFLEKCGIRNTSYLSDYINDSFVKREINFQNKKNIVLYNPQKGYEFTAGLIKTMPDLSWVALENMTTDEVVETLAQGKVYIDFGNHPGKDRFPREAAMCGCCIITGKKGAAAFYEDVPIPEAYKFDMREGCIDDICECIHRCLGDYETEIKKFEEYRKIIKGEHEEFIKKLGMLFCNAKKMN